MAVQTLEAKVRQESGIAILDLNGEIDGLAESALNTAYAEAMTVDVQALILNFGAVVYINSTGIALIVGLLARTRNAGRRLLACRLSPHYVEVFHITRLTDYISIYDDEAGAIAAARRGV